MSDTLTWTAVGNASDWADNSAKIVNVGARRIGVYKHDGSFFALKDPCPHAGVSLTYGPVENGQATCVGHGWQFSLKTGEVTAGPRGFKTPTFAVRVSESGQVEIGT